MSTPVSNKQQRHLDKLLPPADASEIRKINRLARTDFLAAYKLVTRMSIKSVVNDKAWQALRSSLVGTWKTNARQNVSLLTDYVGDMEDPFKVRRVMNYLTGSAFRIGVISHPGITRLLNQLRQRIKE